LKDTFDHDIRKPARIAAYRGGYLPSERRATEERLRAGLLDAVVATNALELGIDIGSLDVCVLNGYPGTIAGTWQRLGRAGRRNRTSLGVLVATSEMLDQFIVRNPDFFRGASPEHARVAPDQLLILMDHVRCAAFELPFSADETFGKENLAEMLSYLEEQGVLHREGERWHWIADSYPANSVSLRSVADGNFVVIDTTAGKQEVIAEVDYASAALTLYEGAIYLVQAAPWQVEALDWKGRKAFVTQTRADYYTEAIDHTRLKILDEFERESLAASRCARGEVHVVRRVVGYKKIRYYTHENVGYGEVHLPDHEMHTSSVWWQIDPVAVSQAFPVRTEALDGFLGAAHAMHSVAALLTMSEHHDLGRAVGDGEGTWFAIADLQGRGKLLSATGSEGSLSRSSEFVPALFLYDNYPGGIGLSVPLFDLRREVVTRAAALVSSCACTRGCPACVGPVLASEEDRGMSLKAAASAILTLLS
jgi:DEAD/DEAH box helicase domain-containing protein